MTQGNRGYYIADSTIGGQLAGKGLFSSEDIKSGEPIITIKRPLMGSLEPERLKDTCANCYVWTEGSSTGSRLYVKEGTTVQLCAGCKRFRYCSRACQKEAWNRGHKYICKNLNPISHMELPKAILSCMEILVQRKHGLMDDQTWLLLCHLSSHLDNFKEIGKYDGIELAARGTIHFSETTLSKDFVETMYARILSNSMTLITQTFDPLGIVIDALLCHINHSCDPNTYVVMDGPQMQLRALTDIKKDEELFIAYVDPMMPYAHRQHDLHQRWFFGCQCSKCLLESSHVLKQEDIPVKEPGFDSQVWDKIHKGEFKHLGDDDTSASERPIIDRVVTEWLERSFLRSYESEHGKTDPAEAINMIKDAMKLRDSTNAWPVWRQPLPSLRDDLIVNMLAMGNYEGAWFECAKRHRHVIPKLYPQMHHPIRVVQTWQMAMLAQYLASMGAEVAPGADLALIAAMLINTINVTSRMSHGAESAFARSVQQKFSEVEGELLGKFGSKDAMNVAIQRQIELLSEMGKLD